LAAVIQGWGGHRLLESYTKERQPIFAETGEALITNWIEKDREVLERYSPERNRAEFEAAWKQLAATASQQSSEPYYAGSSVVTGPPGAACTIHGQHTPAALPGHHLTPQLLSTGMNVFEELGSSLTLIALSADEQSVREFEQAAESLSVPLKVVFDTYEGERQAYGARLVLVRPDQYVCWSGNEGPRDPVALLCQVVGIT
jgi:hypothetical protein